MRSRLYGPNGTIETRVTELKANSWKGWDDFLGVGFGYSGAGGYGITLPGYIGSEFDSWFLPLFKTRVLLFNPTDFTFTVAQGDPVLGQNSCLISGASARKPESYLQSSAIGFGNKAMIGGNARQSYVSTGFKARRSISAAV